MRLFTCTDHKGHWPVGTASIVLASNEAEARSLLDRKLYENNLILNGETTHYTLNEVSLEDGPKAIILNDGDY